MTKHLADHRTASEGGRMKHFLRIARDRSETLWRGVFRRTTFLAPTVCVCWNMFALNATITNRVA